MLVAVAAQFALLEGSRAVRASTSSRLSLERLGQWHGGATVAGLDHGLAVETRRAAEAPEGVKMDWSRLS